MGNFRDLKVYEKGIFVCMEIFKETKLFPVEEKYALTDQIRRSSRSVCSSIGEAYRKRRAHFINKITDADMENTETQVWLDFAFKCDYMKTERYKYFTNRSEEIGKMLGHMLQFPEKYGAGE